MFLCVTTSNHIVEGDALIGTVAEGAPKGGNFISCFGKSCFSACMQSQRTALTEQVHLFRVSLITNRHSFSLTCKGSLQLWEN